MRSTRAVPRMVDWAGHKQAPSITDGDINQAEALLGKAEATTTDLPTKTDEATTVPAGEKD
jgi:hypothetical protein